MWISSQRGELDSLSPPLGLNSLRDFFFFFFSFFLHLLLGLWFVSSGFLFKGLFILLINPCMFGRWSIIFLFFTKKVVTFK